MRPLLIAKTRVIDAMERIEVFLKLKELEIEDSDNDNDVMIYAFPFASHLVCVLIIKDSNPRMMLVFVFRTELI